MTYTDNELSLWMRRVEERLEKLELLSLKEVQEVQEVQEANNDKEINKINPLINDFIRGKNPKNSVEFALAISYYIEKECGITPFTTDDIRNAYLQAREPLPPNISDLVYQASKRGLMMKASNKKKDNLYPLMMTHDGQKFVEGLNLPAAS